MTRVALPGLSLLAAAPHMAALAALDAALRLSATALRVAYPDVDHPFAEHEPAEITTARILVDESDAMLATLDDYRALLRARLDHDLLRWPF